MSNTSRVKQGMCNTIASSKNNPVIKLYCNNLTPKKITLTKLLNMEDYYKKTKTVDILYSYDGIYSVEGNNVYKNIPNDKQIKRMTNSGIDFSFDYSDFKKTLVTSQLPVNPICISTTQFLFCESNNTDKTKLQLVVEGHYNLNANTMDTKYRKTVRYNNFVVDDVYFVLKENIDNYLIKKELNMFLSMLI